MSNLRKEIENIVNEMDKDLQDNKENSMTIYECFDFNEEFNDDIARSLSKAIGLNSNYQEAILKHMADVIAYCGSVVPKMILKRLFKKKMLPIKVKYISLLKWVEDAWIMYKIRNKPFTIPDLEEYIEKCHHSIVKQKLKDILKMIYDKNKVNDSIF